jgi:hypothetical protein
LHQRIYLELRGGCKGFEGTSKYVGALLLLVVVLDLPGIFLPSCGMDSFYGHI